MEEGSTEDMPWGLWLILKVLRKQLQTYTSLLTNHLAAATAAKSIQSCPTLCDPIDGSPPGSPIPGILKARTPEWAAISFSNAWKWKVKVKSLSHVRLFATPWTAAHQAPPSMGFSRQEYWSGLPLPSPTNHSKSQEIPLAQIWFRSCLDCSHQVLGLALNKLNLNSVFSQPWEVSVSTSLTFWFYNIHVIRQNSELLEGKRKVPSAPTQETQKLVHCLLLQAAENSLRPATSTVWVSHLNCSQLREPATSTAPAHFHRLSPAMSQGHGAYFLLTHGFWGALYLVFHCNAFLSRRKIVAQWKRYMHIYTYIYMSVYSRK